MLVELRTAEQAVQRDIEYGQLCARANLGYTHGGYLWEPDAELARRVEVLRERLWTATAGL